MLQEGKAERNFTLRKYNYIILFFSLIFCSTEDEKKEKTSSATSGALQEPIVSSLKYYTEFPYNYVYTTTLQVANQGIEFVVDTGSSNLLILGDNSLCSNCANDYGFDSEFSLESSTSKLDSSWSMFFEPRGIANVEGYSDKVIWGDYTLASHAFGVVVFETEVPNILGLGYRTLAQPPIRAQLPLLERLRNSYNFKNQFSLLLCDTRGTSTLTIGGYDSKITDLIDQVQWTPIPSKQWYTVRPQKLYIQDPNSSSQNLWNWNVQESQTVIIDSGTNPMILPSADLESLIATLKNIVSQNNIEIPDSFWPSGDTQGEGFALSDEEIAKFPDILIDLPNYNDTSQTITLNITPQIYLQKTIGSIETESNGNTTTIEQEQRLFSFEGQESSTGLLVLGSVFMEHYLVLHDRGDEKTVDNDPAARLGFYSSSSLCQ